ncbi:nep1-interacting protein 2-like [Stylonychia lemnae]|uniref:Nep1-interacting protein 2-like n=1 Tax=Stylonychia lemnae TaxID=5949 RepID=A0A078A2Q4_STYLE|nr:nep1-interacting protein 2-like [Stylonychia lemnae]|eukprot:CDW75793.1 nep1-interacting protein 2-like [Stylonychia lemnae]
MLRHLGRILNSTADYQSLSDTTTTLSPGQTYVYYNYTESISTTPSPTSTQSKQITTQVISQQQYNLTSTFSNSSQNSQNQTAQYQSQGQNPTQYYLFTTTPAPSMTTTKITQRTTTSTTTTTKTSTSTTTKAPQIDKNYQVSVNLNTYQTNTQNSNVYNKTIKMENKNEIDLSIIQPFVISAGALIISLMILAIFIKLYRVYISKNKINPHHALASNQDSPVINTNGQYSVNQTDAVDRQQEVNQPQRDNFFREVIRNRSGDSFQFSADQYQQLRVQQQLENQIINRSNNHNQVQRFNNRLPPSGWILPVNEQQTRPSSVQQGEYEGMNPNQVMQLVNNLVFESYNRQAQNDYRQFPIQRNIRRSHNQNSLHNIQYLGPQGRNNDQLLNDIALSDFSYSDNEDSARVNTLNQEGMIIKPVSLPKRKQRKLDRVMDLFTVKGKFDKGFAEFGESNCSICFDDYETNNIIRKISRCGHLFHNVCLENWVAKNIREPRCPLCNLNIMEDEDQNN